MCGVRGNGTKMLAGMSVGSWLGAEFHKNQDTLWIKPISILKMISFQFVGEIPRNM